MLAVHLAGTIAAICAQHGAAAGMLYRFRPKVRDLEAKDRQELANRVLLFLWPSAMVVLSVLFLYRRAEAFFDHEVRWAKHQGPVTVGEWAGRFMVAFNLYELGIYAVYGKGLAFWLHHIVAVYIGLQWLILRTGTFWGCIVLLIEATTPCLVGTRLMKDGGWTHEPLYKLAVSVFWIFWLVVRITALALGLCLFCHDVFKGLVPQHVSWHFVLSNGLSVLGLFVLSCVWFVSITRIFCEVMFGTGKKRRQ
eukprot:TRINITY_DN49279_c0_g1_i1.p1 TRINITY_DN49279_c0_g1~~TRINITY_DN49279_c0_g1_i1.p1  ORF type:complete len:251 (+),score=24.09 TRINITY_DN49279_c0_g1_i1:57-809(+)